jgi:hypothetical protein
MIKIDKVEKDALPLSVPIDLKEKIVRHSVEQSRSVNAQAKVIFEWYFNEISKKQPKKKDKK